MTAFALYLVLLTPDTTGPLADLCQHGPWEMIYTPSTSLVTCEYNPDIGD